MSSRDHILEVPKVILGLRIAQLVVAIVTLGLAAYGITYFSFDGDDLTLFTAIATMIIVVYYFVSTMAAPVIYNYWALLGLDIFGVIFWLISFALLASEVAAYQIVYYNTDDNNDCAYYYDGYCVKKRDLNVLSKRVSYTTVKTYRNAMAAAAGMGGLEFLLFIATLAITGIYLHRHRTAGGHCMPAGAYGGDGGVSEEQKATELQQPVYQQQPAVYQQQPVQQPIYQQQPVQQTYEQHQVKSYPDQQVSAA